MVSRSAGPPRIRVCHFINTDVGIRVHLRNQLLYLQSKGFEIAAACSPGDYIRGEGITDAGIPVKTFPMTRKISPFNDLITLFRLYRYFRREKFDIVHTHSLKPGFLGRVAAFLARVPIRIYTIHGFRFHDNMSFVVKKRDIYLERLGNWFGHIALSQGQLDIELAIRERICKPDQIFYLGNGIDIRQFTAPMDSAAVWAKKQSLGIAPTDRVVGIVGRQTKIKGYFEFIEAAKTVVAQFPSVKFIMIGTSEEGNPDALGMQSLVRQSNLEGIVLPLGKRQDMRELYGIMDVMTLPSWVEGVPRVLIEASICGKPLVATDIPGNREVVQPGLNGLLIPVGDSQALANAILDLLTNEAKAAEMGERGQRRALELFDEQIYFRRLVQAYEDMLRSKLPDKFAVYQAISGGLVDDSASRTE